MAQPIADVRALRRVTFAGGIGELPDEASANGDSIVSWAGTAAADVRHEKDELIGCVSAALLQEVCFPPKKPRDGTSTVEYDNVMRIATLVHTISMEDGEFVLKLALYVRHDLNIRRTAALLVALSAFESNCQPFLTCYMKRILQLPSDWLSTASFAMYQQQELLCRPTADTWGPCSPVKSEPQGQQQQERRGLPNALRRALVATFTMFDEFALSKYNNERSVKRARSKRRATALFASSPTTATTQWTLKDFVRRLHISEPAYAVCCLLGKRYPSTVEEFCQRGLDEGGTRTFDPALCGQRMRLPVAETWETQLSSRGNRGAVWDDLVARNRLPFMATLRNLRNIVLRKCCDETHATLLRRLTSEEEVAKSRQFPYRFLSAYEALQFTAREELEELYDRAYRPQNRRKKLRDKAPTEAEVMELQKTYKAALNQAAEISARLNIIPIRGSSLVILNATHESMYEGASGRAMIDKAIMLSVAFKYACEHCVLLVICGDKHRMIERDFRSTGGMLHHVEKIGIACRNMKDGNQPQRITQEEKQGAGVTKFPYAYLDNVIERRLSLQALVVMDCEHSCYSGQNDAPSLGDLPVYLERMRSMCNEELLFVGLSTSSRNSFVNDVRMRYRHRNDILLTGFSDAVLRIVAERAGGGPRRYIERADEVYNVNRAAICPGFTLESDLQVLQEVFELEKARGISTGTNGSEMLSEEGLTDSSAGSMSGAAAVTTAVSSPRGRASPAPASLMNTWAPSGRRFLSTYQDCRFFISSTFLDMENERNALVLDVFPRLRRWAAEAGLHLNILEVDLRWGITEDASSADLSLSVCLNEVSRCTPFFLGVLGSRYGYCPPTLYHRLDDDVDADDFAWLRQLPHGNEARMSVTEMEMRHALFTATRRTGLTVPRTMAFLVRDHAALMSSLSVSEQRAYAPDTPTTMESMKKLTAYLKGQGSPVIPYTAIGATPMDNTLSAFAMTSSAAMTATAGMTTMAAQQVPLDMTDFSRKAFFALKAIVKQHCGLSLDGSYIECAGFDGDNTMNARNDGNLHHQGHDTRGMSDAGTLYGREYMDQLRFTSTLLKTCVPPMGLVEKLTLFALTGRRPTAASCASAAVAEAGALIDHQSDSERNVLLLQGAEGNGASTIAAAVASHITEMEDPNVAVLHFSCQASDGSLRRLVYYIAFSLVYRLGLEEDFRVRESDSVTTLLQLLPRVYAAARKKKHICIILDGMDKSSYAAEMRSSLGWIVLPGTAPEILFIITATLGSPLSTVLKSRVPPAWSLALPDLSMSERAEVVRRHLASYGKRLQESLRVNELKLLLRKTQANQASYLTYAITHLRLFSAYDTLRRDIVSLPSTLPQLQLETYKKLEERFDVVTCRSVLVALYLSHGIGGMREFNLYRLVSNVSSASRLVALLTGTCLRVTRRRVDISSALFEASIAARYLPRSSDVVDACACMLVAELYFRRLSIDAARYEVRDSIRHAMESIRHDPVETCLFRPKRYTANQLLSLLHLALRAKEYDVLATLATYLPFLENLITDAVRLQRLMNILSQAALSNALLSRRLAPVTDFLQQAYHVLSDRPSLLRQCVYNRMKENIFHGVPNSRAKARMWVRWISRSQHGEEGRTIAFPSTEPLQCLALSDDGKYMAGGSDDMMVRVMPQGAVDEIAASLKHNAPVTALAFLPHRSHILVTGCGRGHLRLWNLEDNSLLQQSLTPHRRCISSLACHPTDNVVCTGSHDSTCAFWLVVGSVAEATVRSSVEPSEVLRHHRAPVSCVAYHSSGEILATGSWEGRVFFINVQRPLAETTCTKQKAYFKLPYEHLVMEMCSPVRALAFTPSMVVTCAVALYDGDVWLYDYASASCSANLKLHAGIPVTSLAFSPDAKLMASANEHGGVCITYAGVAGTKVCSLNGHRRAVNAIAFHQQKPSVLFTSSQERSLKEWSIGQAAHGNDVYAMEGTHALTVTACAAASDGSFFVTGGVDGLAFVFNGIGSDGDSKAHPTSNKEYLFTPLFTLSHEQNRVSCICIGMQNSRILCGTGVGEVFVWAATPGIDRREGRLLQRLRVSRNGVYPVVFIECVRVEGRAEASKQHYDDAMNAASSLKPLCTRATALATNGMLVTWEVHDEDKSMATMRGDAWRGSCSDSTDGEGDGSCSTLATDSDLPEVTSQCHGSHSSRSARSVASESEDGGMGRSSVSSDVIPSLRRVALKWVAGYEDLQQEKEGRVSEWMSSFPCNEDSLAAISDAAEEIVAAVPFVHQREMQQEEDGEEPPLDGHYIVLGRTQCHLAVASLHSLVVVPMRRAAQQCGCATPASDSDYTLEKGENFLCASSCVRVQAMWPENGNSTPSAMLFAVGTSSGTVLLLEASYNTSDGGGAVRASSDDVTTPLMFAHQQRVRLEVRHSAVIKSRHGRRLPVDAVALAAPGTVLTDTTKEPSVLQDAQTSLLLTVGGRDGSVRLFTVFPFRDTAEGVARQKDGAAAVMDEEEDEEDEEETTEEAGEAGRTASISCFQEKGIFFASSGVTAAAVVRMTANSSLRHSRKASAAAAAGRRMSAIAQPNVMYIAGDWLGNVYQLRLEQMGAAQNKANALSRWRAAAATLFRWSAAGAGEGEKKWDRRYTSLGLLPLYGRAASAAVVGAAEVDAEASFAERKLPNWRREERRITAMFAPSTAEATGGAPIMAALRETDSLVLPPSPPPPPPPPPAEPAPPTLLAADMPSYEMILQSVPPGLDAQQRKQWLKERQRLLIDALQAQRRAAKARAVLAQYSKDVLLSLDASFKR